MSAVVGLPFVGFFIFGYCLIWGCVTRYLAIAYLLHMFYDLKFNEGVSQPLRCYQKSSFIHYVSSYFPIRAVATQEIPKDFNYIIGIHPHGMLTFSGVLYANPHHEQLKKIFGEGVVSFCTAPFNLSIPLQRNFFQIFGSIVASENGITRRLNSAKSGKHVGIVLGGADEALISSSNEHRIILKRRKGFCRIALKTGSHLIPSYAFGEGQTFDTIRPPPGSILDKAQQFCLKYLQIGVPIVKGAARFHYFLVMPKRVPITAVYGKPIPVSKIVNPSREEVNELHEKYVQGLVELFDANKEIYLGDKNAKLIIE